MLEDGTYGFTKTFIEIMEENCPNPRKKFKVQISNTYRMKNNYDERRS